MWYDPAVTVSSFPPPITLWSVSVSVVCGTASYERGRSLAADGTVTLENGIKELEHYMETFKHK